MQEFTIKSDDSGSKKITPELSKTEREIPLQQILNYEQFGVEPTGRRIKESEMKSGLRPGRNRSKVTIALALSLLALVLVITVLVGYFYMKGKGYL
jgi:hypothetical protein